METLPCCNSVAGHQIATNFCTCHDSTAVVSCTNICSDCCVEIKVTVKWNFHQIWISMENAVSEMGPWSSYIPGCVMMLIYAIMWDFSAIKAVKINHSLMVDRDQFPHAWFKSHMPDLNHMVLPPVSWLDAYQNTLHVGWYHLLSNL